MIVQIQELHFEAIIGILDHERTTPQRVVVDATFEYDYEDGRFLDYAEAATIIKEHIVKHRFKLLEEALLSTAGLLKERYPFITSITLSIQKPDILPDCTPRVTFKRSFT